MTFARKFADHNRFALFYCRLTFPDKNTATQFVHLKGIFAVEVSPVVTTFSLICTNNFYSGMGATLDSRQNLTFSYGSLSDSFILYLSLLSCRFASDGESIYEY